MLSLGITHESWANFYLYFQVYLITTVPLFSLPQLSSTCICICILQVYLVTTVPLFSLPQLSSDPLVQSTLTFLLPTALPIAHIGMVVMSSIYHHILYIIIYHRPPRCAHWHGRYMSLIYHYLSSHIAIYHWDGRYVINKSLCSPLRTMCAAHWDGRYVINIP